jgi:hypothetical protein
VAFLGPQASIAGRSSALQVITGFMFVIIVFFEKKSSTKEASYCISSSETREIYDPVNISYFET